MLRQSVIGLDRKHAAIQRLCVVAFALLMQRERPLESLELLKLADSGIVFGRTSDPSAPWSVLELLAAAAGAGIVATRRWHDAFADAARPATPIWPGTSSSMWRRLRQPVSLTHRHAVAAQLQELERARDRGVKEATSSVEPPVERPRRN
jgi:hypothetical protein